MMEKYIVGNQFKCKKLSLSGVFPWEIYFLPFIRTYVDGVLPYKYKPADMEITMIIKVTLSIVKIRVKYHFPQFRASAISTKL